jgi:hypothetical protein
MQTAHSSLRYKISAVIAALAVAWFSLGTALNTIVASASGKRIDIVVCSGAGVKTISVPAHDSGDGDNSASVIKHCSNAPIYALIAIPGTPIDLHFEAPRTVAVWQYNPVADFVVQSLQNNRPPPGRAPPEQTLA